MSIIRTRLLANEILAQLRGTTDGHCARVDFLERTEAISVCQYLFQDLAGQDLAFHILTTHQSLDQKDGLYITTDKAIEIRNRKRGHLFDLRIDRKSTRLNSSHT